MFSYVKSSFIKFPASTYLAKLSLTCINNKKARYKLQIQGALSDCILLAGVLSWYIIQTYTTNYSACWKKKKKNSGWDNSRSWLMLEKLSWNLISDLNDTHISGITVFQTKPVEWMNECINGKFFYCNQAHRAAESYEIR